MTATIATLPGIKMPELSDKQRWSVNKADCRLNIWHGSVRASKTVATLWAWMMYVSEAPPGDLMMVGKTLGSLKRNIINPILEIVGKSGKYFSGKQEFHLFGRVIHTFGASDERSEGKIRGGTFAGCLGDEITLWPESFFTMMLSRLSVLGAKFFGTTNPDNPNHWFRKRYLLRKAFLNIDEDGKAVKGMSLFHFSIDDNPFLPPEYVAALKKEYVGLWYKRFIEGKWCVAEGAIYDFFDEKKHVLQDLPEADYYTVGFDYGTSVPTVFTLFGHSRKNELKVWAEREYYYDPVAEKKSRTDAQFSEDLQKFMAPVRKKIRGIYGDPAAESFMVQLDADKVRRVRDADNDVLNGIRTVSRMLNKGEYKISKNCIKTIEEKYGYMWDPKKQELGLDEPIKKDDHASDAERYDLHTQFGSKKYDLEKLARSM